MTTTAQPNPRTAAIIRCLSRPRLGPYLAASGGSTKAALRLYQWNIELSGAVYEALHIVEGVLRNALDAELVKWNAGQIDRGTGNAHSADWLMDPARLLRRLCGDDITKATDRAARELRAGGRTPAHPDVLAQLTFGTWRFLLPTKDPGRKLLWRQSLSKAFPNLATSSQKLVDQVAGIHRLRNRVAHLEPLLRPGTVEHEFASMRAVLAAIDPIAESWFVSRQRITPLLKARP